jgi:hypothetical protein
LKAAEVNEHLLGKYGREPATLLAERTAKHGHWILKWIGNFHDKSSARGILCLFKQPNVHQKGSIKNPKSIEKTP